MRKIKLNKKDYEKIRDMAQDIWLAKGQKELPNVCVAYVEAFSIFLSSNNLILIDGEIYEKDNKKKNRNN